MPDERRRGPRASVNEARVACEGASGERVRGRGLDLGEGGIFVQADKLPAVGARLSLEVHLAGEPTPWAAVGRVIWRRDLASKDGKPRGMGIAFIDVDDAARAAIERVLGPGIAAHSTEGLGPRPPSRERTVLGVGLAPAAHAVAAAPIVAVAPPRERTVLGLAPADAAQPPTERGPAADDLPDWPDEPPEPEKAAAPAVEQSVPIELTAAKARAPSPAPQMAREPSISHPAGVPRKGTATRWVLVLLLLGATGAGGYAQRARLRSWLAPNVARALSQLPLRLFR
jgi:uncharacterized protein (TIGR02266 family)